MELKSRRTEEEVTQWILEHEYEAVVLVDGLDDAFLGCTPDGVAVYNIDRCLEIIAEDDNLTIEDAVEHFEFNISGAYVGEKTPLFIEVMI